MFKNIYVTEKSKNILLYVQFVFTKISDILLYKNNNSYHKKSLSDIFSNILVIKETNNFTIIDSNDIIQKIIFFFFLCILFFLFCSLGIIIIDRIYSYYKGNPYIIHGIMDGSQSLIIPQNINNNNNDNEEKNNNTIIINRSNNKKEGIEFTWCLWLLLEGNTTLSNIHYQNIFNKGDIYYDTINGISSVNNGPGLYLSSLVNNENILHIIMDSIDINEGPIIIDINSVPFNKWFHVTMRLQNKTLDVYINDILAKRSTMKSIPKQNFNDINICQNGGFTGKISNLRYYEYALTSLKIDNIVLNGPNINFSKSNKNNYLYSSYLSSSWYKCSINHKKQKLSFKSTISKSFFFI